MSWRTWSLMQIFVQKVPDRSSGDLACDSYDLYKEDVKLLKRMNAQAYRLSIAWSRVLPKGRLIGGIDENGIKYYNNLINELKANGIEPYVTIFHWDVPQTLEDEYGGFLSRRIVEDYKNYAELLFQRFGDRVKFWITLNQPYSLASKGYGDGSYPPGRCTGCEFGGNSGTEPYIVAHNQLLAHAKAVALYRKRYQKSQGGKIGTTLIGRWFTPLNKNSIRDAAASKRAFDFFVGWFLDPLVYGRYPKIMRQMVGHRLPKFTPQESKLVKGSLDFLGLNYYVTQYATNAPPSPQPSALTDARVTIGYYRNGVPIGVQAPSFVYYPPGFRQILNYIKNNYGNPLTYITENGVADLDTGNLTLPAALADNGRIQNHCSHLSCLKCSIDDGCNVAGYFAWSLMDNYEFGNGYTLRKETASYELENVEPNANIRTQNVCNPACKAKEPFNCDNPLTFNRTSFPKNFIFGAATSAYQIEGAAHRALNGWDYYTHRYPDRSSGDLACDSYDLYKEDVKLLKRMNAQAYRLSIAWSRVLPKGRLIGGIDENGIKYYNNLINELKANGIEPYVTIFHWDVPQTLEDEYGGFLSRRIVEDYKNYAELLFQRFGDRVKFWITLNQPYSLASKGYGDGSYPPGRCTGCEFGGNSGTEPYIVAHNQLLAHAKAVALYRKRYQKSQGGKIGTTLIGRWFTPLNKNSIRDAAASKRAFDFFVGWFLDPLVYGRYPKIMRQMVGHRLPKFTPQESKLVKGSLDFLGLNYYVTQYATNAPPSPQPSALTDARVTIGYYRNGVPIGVQAPSFVYYPPGFRQILNYIKNNYGNPLTYITENGVADLDTGNLTLPAALADNGRIQNHCSHLSCLKCSIDDGCNVAGYFAWSLMDNYEFGNGYTLRFGMNWVNFTNPADRREKASDMASEDYINYAELLFQRFGDRVKFWITLNQPYSLASKGYGDGSYPPGRCTGCEFGGNSGTEPYIVAHNQLLAHAKAVALYRKRYQKSQGGKIGTTLIGRWFTPLNKNSIRDAAASKRAFDFFVGWFLDPLVYGRYPKIMRQMAPSFVYYPPGFRQILNYIKNNYGNPLTYITENGVADLDTGNLTLPAALADNGRIQNHCSHLSCLKCSIDDGCNVAGYFAWSLMDNYEFGNGYTLRFGMNWVNFTNPADRREKASGKWFSKFIIKK
ncbi:hypothetical protein Bca4012_037396 [Brassica carinata]